MANPVSARSTRSSAPSSAPRDKDATKKEPRKKDAPKTFTQALDLFNAWSPASREKEAPKQDAPKTLAQALELKNAPPGARITDVQEKPGGGRNVTVEVPVSPIRRDGQPGASVTPDTPPTASPFGELDRLKARFVPPPAFAPKTGRLPEPRPAFGAIRPEVISTFTAGASGEAGGKPQTGGKIEIGGFVAAGATLAATDGPAPFLDVLGLGVVAVGAVLHGARNLVDLGKDAGVLPFIRKQNLEDAPNGVRPDLLPDPAVEQINRDRVFPPVSPKDPDLADPNAANKRPAPPEPEFPAVLPGPTWVEPPPLMTVFPRVPKADEPAQPDEPGSALERVFRTGRPNLILTERLMGEAPTTEEEKRAVIEEILMFRTAGTWRSVDLFASDLRKTLDGIGGGEFEKIENGRGWSLLTPSELAAVQAYTGMDYMGANAARFGNYTHGMLVTGNRVPTGKLVRLYLQLGEILIGAQDRIPLKSGVFHRGVTLSPTELAKYTPGNIVQASAFMSTSERPDPDFEHLPVQLHIKGQGMDLTKVNWREKEVLLMPGTRFRVIDRKVEPRVRGEPQTHIYLEQIR